VTYELSMVLISVTMMNDPERPQTRAISTVAEVLV